MDPGVNRTIIADYEIIAPIGQGGMGTVFLARRRGDGRPVAIKTIRADSERYDAVTQRFRREIEISKELAHPYVVSILDGGVTDKGELFLVMEYFEGRTLDDLLNTPLDFKIALRVLRHAAEALSYVHSVGLVHRDVKPANILLAGPDRTVLLDFGLALSEEKTRMSMTADVLGTLFTMAPEQLRAESIDGRADIYSLGVTMYWSLTTCLPYDTSNIHPMIYGVKPPVPFKITSYRPDIPDGLARVVMRCMAYDKNDRFQSADDLLRALEDTSIGVRMPRKVTREEDSHSFAVNSHALTVIENIRDLHFIKHARRLGVFLLVLCLCLPVFYWFRRRHSSRDSIRRKQRQVISARRDLPLLRTELLKSDNPPTAKEAAFLGKLVETLIKTDRLGVNKAPDAEALGRYYLARYALKHDLRSKAVSCAADLLSHHDLLFIKDHGAVLFSKILDISSQAGGLDLLISSCRSFLEHPASSDAAAVHRLLLAAFLLARHKVDDIRECLSLISKLMDPVPAVLDFVDVHKLYLKALKELESDESKDRASRHIDVVLGNSALSADEKFDLAMSAIGTLSGYRGVGLQGNRRRHLLKAEQLFREYLFKLVTDESDPRWLYAHTRYLWLLDKLDRFDEASRGWIELETRHPWVKNKYAYIRDKASHFRSTLQYGKAIKLLRSALKTEIVPERRQEFRKTLNQIEKEYALIGGYR